MSPPETTTTQKEPAQNIEEPNLVQNGNNQHQIPMDVHTIRRSTYKNLIIVSLGFLFLFTAFQALQNLQSSIHTDAKLGLASLCVIYASLVLSCMFVPPILIDKLGAKYTIIVAMSGYVVYTLSMFYPHWGTLIPASILLGTGAAPLWASKCAYVTTMGIRLGRSTGQSADIIITKLFGIFFLVFQSGQIWGNLIASQILEPTGSNSTDDFDVSEKCGANYCPSTILNADRVAEPSTVKILMGIYLVFGFLAMLVIFFFLDKIELESSAENKERGNCSLFISTLKFLRERKMQLLIPITMFSGLEQGFVFADFSKAYVTCSIGIEKVGLIMIAFGVVDAFFSLFLGKIVEWTGRPTMIGFGFLVNMAVLILFLTLTPSKNTVYVFYLGAALWGFSDAVWQTQINAFYGVLFPTQQEAAFSNYRLWESIGFVISFAYGDVICVDAKIYILMVVMCIGCALYGVIEVMRRRESASAEIVALNAKTEEVQIKD